MERIRDLLYLYLNRVDDVIDRIMELYPVSQSLRDNYRKLYTDLLNKSDEKYNSDDKIITVYGCDPYSPTYEIEVFVINPESIYFDNVDFTDWKEFVNSRFVTMASLLDTVAALLYHISAVSFVEPEIKAIKENLERSYK